MHIGLFVKDFAVGKKFSKDGLPTKSGAEFHAENHAKQLIKRGNEVTIFAKKRYRFTKVRENIDGIDLVRLHAPFRWLEIIIRFVTTHKSLNAIYILGTPKFAVWAVLLARLFNIPTTLALTGKAEIFDKNKNWRNKIFAQCTRYIALSNEIKKGFIDLAGIKAEYINVLPQGINTKKFVIPTSEEKKKARLQYGIDENELVLLFCARVVMNKGIDTIIKVWPVVHKKFPTAKFVVVGGGQTELIDEITEMGKQNNNSVLVIGEVDNPLPYYQISDVYIFPSRHEGLPTTLMEAMSCGLTPVVSDIGGCEDLVENGVSGYRVQTENVSGYVEKIVELFENEKKRKDMGKKAANFVRENCDYGSVIWKLEKIVEGGNKSDS